MSSKQKTDRWHHHILAVAGWIGLDRIQEAAAELARIPQSVMDTPRFLHLKWLVEHRLGKHSESLVTADRLMELAPEDSDGYIAAAISLQRLSRSDEAVACLEVAQTLCPERPLVDLHLASAYLSLGLTDDYQRELANFDQKTRPGAVACMAV